MAANIPARASVRIRDSMEARERELEGLDGRVCTFMILESIANLSSKKTSNITVTFQGNSVYLTASSGIGSVGASLSRSYQLLMLT